MYEDLIEQTKRGDMDAAALLVQLNRGYLLYLAKQVFYVNPQNYDDFVQLAFFAVIQTSKAYKFDYSTKDTFKALWKKYILKEYFDFKMETYHALKVSRSTYSKINAEIGVDNSILKTCGVELETVKGEDLYFDVEQNLLKEQLWLTVKEILSEKDFIIIYRNFKKEEQLKTIAKDFGVTSEAIRKRKVKALEKLKNNKYVQCIAREYYGF